MKPLIDFFFKPSVEEPHKKTLDEFLAMKAKIKNDQIGELQDLYPLGSEFNYFGALCRVTHTYEMYPVSHFVAYYGFLQGVESRPMLIADYLDKNGVIRQLRLSYDEAKRLKR